MKYNDLLIRDEIDIQDNCNSSLESASWSEKHNLTLESSIILANGE